MLVSDVFSEFAPEFIQRFQDAIRNKPIPRKSPYKGEFSAVANASGALANSAEIEINGYTMQLLAFDYWKNIAYGQAPGQVPDVNAIQQWILTKGLDLNASSTALNIGFFGSTIFQKFQGQDSGVFSEVMNEEIINRMTERLALELIVSVEQTQPSKI